VTAAPNSFLFWKKSHREMSQQSKATQLSDAEPILRIAGVSKAYGAKVVADDLNLTIERGEFLTFLGASGSGKSTTLRIVAGLERADSGSIWISGKRVDQVPPWRRNLGMMFQQYAVFPHMTVAQNIAYGLHIRGLARRLIDDRIDELLDLVGLGGMRDKHVTVLSGGEQQRVALARALAPKPLILLLDEPLSALDEKIRREMQSELKRIQRSTNTTFLYVTHDQEEALTMSNRIVVLHNGRIEQVGSPESIFLRPESAFVARFFRGSNVFEAECIALDDRSARVKVLGLEFDVPRGAFQGAVGLNQASIRSEAIRIGSALEESCLTMPATVADWTFRGIHADWRLTLLGGETVVATTPRHVGAPHTGAVMIGFKPEDVILLSH
jgi:ABC-type Fe3+/spermidine/putrescine transport system ATPase subunit